MATLFQKEKHISYWLRCLRTPLPHQYTANDANRMSLTFFILSALDLLGVLFQRTTAAEREEYADWIYGCQHPEGGFRAFPGTAFGHKRNADNAAWDPAHVPATYFGLGSLAILGDDLSRVKRSECLHWLRKMQRPGGSFGETLGENGRIEGGMDTRFAYCAAGVVWILRGSGDGLPDIDTDALVHCISDSESYDSGISLGPFHEAHAGLTYCAIGALSFLDRLPSRTPSLLPDPTLVSLNNKTNVASKMGLSSVAATTKWLLSRLTTDIDEEEEFEDEGNLGIAGGHTEADSHHTPSSFQKLSSRPMDHSSWPSHLGDSIMPIDLSEIQWVGCNGRCNKLADTCYVFWVTASLAMLKSLHLAPNELVRNYLLEKTQHLLMGGFGKLPGSLPDLYHAYLGLAALCLLNEGSEEDEKIAVETLDPALCFSARARVWIESLPWRVKKDAVG